MNVTSTLECWYTKHCQQLATRALIWPECWVQLYFTPLSMHYFLTQWQLKPRPINFIVSLKGLNCRAVLQKQYRHSQKFAHCQSSELTHENYISPKWKIFSLFWKVFIPSGSHSVNLILSQKPLLRFENKPFNSTPSPFLVKSEPYE